MARRPCILIVGEEHLTLPLAKSLEERGIECLRVTDGAKAAALIDVAEKEGYPLEVAFLSSELRQAQLEWLLAYIRAKNAFALSRVIVLGAESASKIKYWLTLGATSCVGTSAEDTELTAAYWAAVLKPSA